jgi:hypothetical protein
LNRLGGNATGQVQNQGDGTNPNGGIEHSRIPDRNWNQTCSNTLWQMVAATCRRLQTKNKQQIGKE